MLPPVQRVVINAWRQGEPTYWSGGWSAPVGLTGPQGMVMMGGRGIWRREVRWRVCEVGGVRCVMRVTVCEVCRKLNGLFILRNVGRVNI